MGKTVFGAVVAEELAAAKLRWAWLDPLGVSYGLRHSADGKGKGVECLILGGPHGDIPIEPDGGAAVADVVVEETCNVLIDFSRKPSGQMWGVGEKIRFVTAYARRLFQRQGDLIGGRRREPLMQFLDEGARYIPQNVPASNPGLADCVSAWQQVVEEGRNIGLGVCVITQRSARISKDVAELADAMVAFRTIGPNSLRAVLDWLGEHVERERIKDLAATVRTLDRGSALIVSPGWLGVEKVVPIRMRHTFDSSATPKPGQRKRVARGPGAKPDIAKIRERMAATIEKAKAEDPKALRARIAELEREIKATANGVSARSKVVVVEKAPKIQRVEVPVLSAKDRKLIERARDHAEASTSKAAELAKALSTLDAQVTRFLAAATNAAERTILAQPRLLSRRHNMQPTLTPPKAAPLKSPPSEVANGGVPPARQKILNGLAFVEQVLGNRDADRDQLAFLSEQSPTSSGYANHLGALRSANLIDYPAKGRIALTDAGRAIAVVENVPRTSAELQALVQRRLPPARWRIIETLIDAYPNDVDRAELGERAEQSPTSSGYANHLGALRSLGLLDYPNKGRVVATPALFLEGR
jgi:hypothetical protein